MTVYYNYQINICLNDTLKGDRLWVIILVI